MQAKDNHDGPEGTHDESGDDGHRVEEPEQPLRHQVRNQVCHGANHQQRDHAGDEQGQHAAEEAADGLRQLGHGLFYPGLQVDGQNDGDDGLKVAGARQLDGYAEEDGPARVRERGGERLDVRVAEEGRHGYADPLVALEAVGRGEGDYQR